MTEDERLDELYKLEEELLKGVSEGRLENFDITGIVTLKVLDEDGNIKDEVTEQINGGEDNDDNE